MKKLITILAVLALLVSTIALVTVSAATEETVYSGTCGADGDNLTWTLDTATGELVISGEGDMKNYSFTDEATSAPWYAYISSINNVTIKNGVTSIGKSAFDGCSGLTSVTIPNSVTSISDFAFYNCSGLTSIEIPNSVTSIGDYAFDGCSGLTNINIPNSVTSVGNYAFDRCTNLKDVNFCGTDAQWAVIASKIPPGVSVNYHTWDNGTETTPPTHITEGVKTFTCSICGDSKTESIDKLPEHTYGEWIKHDADKHAKVCACGDVVYANHAWDNGVITTAPTHLADGQKTYTCTDCGETKFETVAKTTEHTYGEWISVDGNEHKHICSCGDEVKEAHDWNEGEIISAPTAKDEGTKLYRCEACDELKLEAIPVIEEEGCGAYLGGGVSVILLVSGLSAVTLRKKKRK